MLHINCCRNHLVSILMDCESFEQRLSEYLKFVLGVEFVVVGKMLVATVLPGVVVALLVNVVRSVVD